MSRFVKLFLATALLVLFAFRLGDASLSQNLKFVVTHSHLGGEFDHVHTADMHLPDDHEHVDDHTPHANHEHSHVLLIQAAPLLALSSDFHLNLPTILRANLRPRSSANLALQAFANSLYRPPIRA